MSLVEFHSQFLNQDFKFQTSHTQIDEIYRNYRTRIPPQDTFSDILDDVDEQNIVRAHSDALSNIDLSGPGTHRPFQYAKAFPEIKKDDFFRSFIKSSEMGNFPIGRFGDGMDYGVLYCALDLQTSEDEAIHHAVLEFLSIKHRMKEEVFIIDRKMVKFGFKGSFLNLRNEIKIKKQIISEDYSFCQELGKRFYKEVDALQTPSARNADGTCFPLFNPECVRNFDTKKSFVYNFRISINKKKPEEILVENIRSRTLQTSTVLKKST
jgi:hypothetical protein